MNKALLPLLPFAILAACSFAAGAAERRSFAKAEPVEIAFSDESGRCYVHPLTTDGVSALSVPVDPFICQQLGAEEQRRADLRRLRYVRPNPTPAESSSDYSGYP